MIPHAIQKLWLRYRGYPEGWVPLDYRLQYIICALLIEISYAILYRECKATFSYLLMYFVPQFTEAIDIITFESVIFPMRFCVYIKKSYLRVAITYFTFKYTIFTILLSKQC